MSDSPALESIGVDVMYHLSMWCALQNANLKIILHVMCPGSIKKPSRCNGFDKHCQESVLDSFPVSILKGLAFSSCKGHCECSDLKPYFPDPAFFKKKSQGQEKGFGTPINFEAIIQGFFSCLIHICMSMCCICPNLGAPTSWSSCCSSV